MTDPLAPRLRLSVAADGRRLLAGDGKPFFWLGDTAWALLARLDRDETLEYLDARRAQGFNVVQTVGLMEFDGVRTPARANGALPLVDTDPAQPNDSFWDHVAWVVAEAARRGLLVALLPTWGDKWNRKSGVGPEIFDEHTAEAFGRWLGERFRDLPLVWVLGGDRPIETAGHGEIIRGMARGLRAGDGGRHLLTFHPPGQRSSAEWLHAEPWLDFNLLQSGHTVPEDDNAWFVEADHARVPVKPVLDAEPRYEDHPIRWRWDQPSAWDPALGYFEAVDVRRAAYSAVFAGACGHTYGANGVFQIHRAGEFDGFGARRTWREALHLPGAAQMGTMRNFLESGPWWQLEPDRKLVTATAPSHGTGKGRVLALRDVAGASALVYIPDGQTVTLDLSRLSARPPTWWFNPCTGEWQPAEGSATGGGGWVFASPRHQDWVLSLGFTFEPAPR